MMEHLSVGEGSSDTRGVTLRWGKPSLGASIGGKWRLCPGGWKRQFFGSFMESPAFTNRTKFLCLFFETTCVTLILTSIVKNIPDRSLPLKAWVPFNYVDGYFYWPVYLHQVLGLIYVGMIHASYDTFVVGVMLILCSQLKILQHRNSEMNLLKKRTPGAVVNPKILEKEFVMNSVKHHQLLQQFAETFNNIIIYVIFIQYSVSSFVTCVTAYKLVNLEAGDPEFAFTILYCSSMIIQTFFYCWYGNEVILESANIGNSLYTSRWYSLETGTVRDVMMIMKKMQHSMKFSCSPLFVLSVDSFKNVSSMGSRHEEADLVRPHPRKSSDESRLVSFIHSLIVFAT
ncbi:odorant receptor 46a-like isoform X3 [Diachasmimorpha longicaudata]|uniref:odorant receptor 46a-like isoform X3 n=1 Tax=Diachasmimorpha longicaudata TaxID=58733 RepID=UPI0030B8B001